MFKFFKVPVPPDEHPHSNGEPNRLQRYVQAQSMQDMAKLAAEISPEAKQMIGMNVQALLGYLPASEFNTTIMCNKESLQNLLASAMLTGYFMHAMEYRMVMDEIFETGQSRRHAEPPSAPESPLKSPEDLFQSTIIDEAQEAPATEEESEPTNSGEFLSKPDLLHRLKEENPLHISLEINTQMDLESLLNELRFIRDRYESMEQESDETALD